jgi:hypothetical protein
MEKTEDNWYCHNICNYTKLDKYNNEIFKRNFPLIKQPIILDIRPDIKPCNGGKYISQDIEINSKINKNSISKNTSFDINLFPKRSDKDCFFCGIVKCKNNFTPNKPYLIDYLKSIDIDSYIRGLSYPLSNCDKYKKNPLICSEPYLCMNCKTEIEWNPQLVNIINRWNIPAFKGLFTNIKVNDNSTKFYCQDSMKIVPREQLWNNQTKTLYNTSFI